MIVLSICGFGIFVLGLFLGWQLRKAMHHDTYPDVEAEMSNRIDREIYRIDVESAVTLLVVVGIVVLSWWGIFALAKRAL